MPAALFGAAIVASAFLLFQVQPLIAKLILPWFGGSAAVWTSCMLFFQVALLAGYAYAHWLGGRPRAHQAAIHCALLLASLAFLPIVPSAWWKPQGGEDPLLRILGLLAATVGLPYFLLSSTSPLLQNWYSRSSGGELPWRFFALSNAGSMAGLLAYPVLIEPALTNRQQTWSWSAAYAMFALLCAAVALKVRSASKVELRSAAKGVPQESAAWPPSCGPAPSLPEKTLWLALAACGSALLLAVTDHLTQNVAAIPFLWVLPLSLYLLSFILCFDSERWYNRWLFIRLGAIALPAITYAISDQGIISDLLPAIAFFCAALFILLMICHGELARRKPAPAYLTSFYLMVSAGGALGGALIGFVAPYVFNALYDLPVVLSLTAFVLVWLIWRDTPAPRGSRVSWPFALAAGLAAGISIFLAQDVYKNIGHARLLTRNFYGALVVFDSKGSPLMGPYRTLRHGTIDHGEQFLWPQNQRHPTTYYARHSGVGRAISVLQMQGSMNVGVIGLGAGTLATYARPIDHYAIYDINPAVPKIASTQFTFLRDCMAPHEIVLGDARLSLEREPPRGFDLLAVDAFSGDAIPVHLLTREAFRLYWRHLKPDGVLAVHTSNKYLALGPVVALAAAEDGKQAMMIEYEGDDDKQEAESDWVLVSSRPGFFDQDEIRKTDEKIHPIHGLREWTDDYSNLYRILK